MPNDLIVKSNSLVTASYDLTVNEHRLILAALAMIPPQQQIDHEVGYTVSAIDFAERYGIHPKTAYRELREAANRLFERSIVIKTHNQTLKARWVSMILMDNETKSIYDNAEVKKVVLWFNPKITPYLINLTDNFTKYSLKDVTHFNKSYSFRFYEFMMQFKATGCIKISIKELRERLDLVNKYIATRDLKVWVIDSAIAEINEKTPYKVEYTLKKTGKKFTHIEIKFKEKTKKQLEKLNRDKDTPDLIAPIAMTDNQRAIFASKLAHLPALGNCAPVGMSMPDYVERIKNELLDPEKADFYRPYLKELGFIERRKT